MRIAKIKIRNFRGIKEADIDLGEHSLLIGPNNVGKSTVLEALDLALGPDRLNSPDAISEQDFFKCEYIQKDGDPIKIYIECHLIGLNKRQCQLFQSHLEFWDTENNKVLEGELSEDAPEGKYLLDCVRIAFEGYYDSSEDDFVMETFFLNPPLGAETDQPERVSKNEKREIGYLYLRFLRTGSRALSLERGSLLDIILQLQEIKLSSWQKILESLQGVGNQFDSDPDFIKLLDRVSERVRRYTPLKTDSSGKSTHFEVTNLTRRDLKKSLNLFVGTEPIDFLVPYRNVGSGTINIFLFALMSIIADLKRENDKNVIFAMEEPEVALPPYTQRRVISEILKISNQSLVTTHSPYIMENYLDRGIFLLKNQSSDQGHFLVTKANFCSFNSKTKNVKRSFRTQLSEGLLSRAIFAVEGPSDRSCVYAISDKLQELDHNYEHLDTQGITVISCDGSGTINDIGNFFHDIQIKTYAFYDSGQTVDSKFFDINKNHSHQGLEKLLTEEIPESILKEFLKEAQGYADFPTNITIDQKNIKKTVCEILIARKGFGYEAKLINLCGKQSELPVTLVNFITEIQNDLRNSTT